jgi:hypothetical protein
MKMGDLVMEKNAAAARDDKHKIEGTRRLGIIVNKVEKGDVWVDVLWNDSIEPDVEAIWHLEVVSENMAH